MAPPIPPADPDRMKPVAEVNGVPIPKTLVEQIAAAQRANLQAQGFQVKPEDEAKIKSFAVDVAIQVELLHQAALAADVKADPAALEQILKESKARFPDEATFRQALQQAGLTEESLRSDMERQLVVQTYTKSIGAGAKVDETEVRKFYDSHKEMFREGEQVRASQILLRVNEADPPEKKETARTRAEEAHRRAVAGEDFAVLAKEFSQAPTAAKGGDLGFFPKGVMVPKFEEVAFTTPVGQITPVFETPFGYNVLKIVEKKDSRVRDYDEVKAGLLLELARRAENDLVGARAKALREKAKVRILDPAYAGATAAPTVKGPGGNPNPS